MTVAMTITSAKCDDLYFIELNAEEQLGELFKFRVKFESQDSNIDLSALLGSPMTVTLTTENGFIRYFNGIVCEAAQTGVSSIENLVYAQYSVTLVPKLWLLGQMVDCRIFTNMTTSDIIKQLLTESGYSDIKLSLTGNYTPREYCVQYREDCLSFVHRLMEQDGIYYYFTHDESTHTMVLADSLGAHSATDGFALVPYASQVDSVLRKQATISSFASARGVDAATFKLTDYNPLKPKASLLSSDTTEGHQPEINYSVFDFPGAHGDTALGQHYANVRAEAFTASRSKYMARTEACSAQIGGLFTLTHFPRLELNQEYLIIGTKTYMHGGGRASGSGSSQSFQCYFDALESRIPFRKEIETEKPKIVGLQTAVVTGSKTDEDIAVDQYGRVEVTFHWNTPDKKNAKCSCPVRVATSWAGKNWGAISIPRVGQEVVVSFLEGDPERPLIIGSVYNASNMPPYSLPDNKTRSGVISRSLLGTAADANELRFEDKKGSEDFFMHAQKDMHQEVENDLVVTIDHNETVTIKNDRSHSIGNNDTQNIKQNYTLTAGSQLQLVCGSASITLKSSGEVEINGVNLTINGQSQVGIKGAMTSIEGSGEMQVSGGLIMIG
ncbi:type VI secretion system Vgr family protein [Dyella acidisoli]|uniref:Type VI secretion system protein VgrG n=1 Tax=Dyella acidisoli TaxID=1867834 RepID=A0ABQ5XM20_9GAMM|nr:type VI secretion system tip protein TssI/VgrG [Dyella acidisoli]GLQ91560.1 type VI secretion system protein VgrG [Dyella acidisoli]